MSTTSQRHFDLTTQAGWDQFKEMLISTLGEDLQGRLNGTSTETETETDDNESEVQRRKDQERQHRNHLRRVKELERDNRRRNPGR